ncbi:MAG TPA: acyl carrier protein [Gammaproteobacteria bacterium]|nr:acyl carrier protein [Gammaproteobacteria bacterium]
MPDIKTAVREYISENFLMGQSDIQVDDDTSFLEIGLLDSTGVIELVSYLEEEFGIQVEDDEISPENLDSLDCIARYVESKIQ